MPAARKGGDAKELLAAVYNAAMSQPCVAVTSAADATGDGGGMTTAVEGSIAEAGERGEEEE